MLDFHSPITVLDTRTVGVRVPTTSDPSLVALAMVFLCSPKKIAGESGQEGSFPDDVSK